MLQLFIKYKSVLAFILTFLGSYLALSFIYGLYLDLFQSSKYFPDFFTYVVARKSEALIEFLGYASEVVPNQGEPSMKLYVEGVFLARIVEGCNSISIIILFISFLFSFFGKFKTTMLYLMGGVITIYVINIFRIALLSITLYEYPQYTTFLHSVVFPLIIYGTVFILWVFWVRIFSKPIRNEG
ncbi:exosortase family protein XrtF [Gillisia lutea]|uniref:exosortase family protein XrtF n=1 Tax=Gillisia lutea TaxID=2909668 RepID=UPI00402BC473